MNVTQLKILHKQLASDIRFLVYRSAIYYDKKRKKNLIWKKIIKYIYSEKILRFKNQATNSITLSSVLLKLKKINSVNYELKFFKNM